MYLKNILGLFFLRISSTNIGVKMKNYKEHLRSVSTIKKLNEKRSKVLRASAIFPCFTNKDGK